MQNEVPLTITTLRNDPEQLAYFQTMNDSFFNGSRHKTLDGHNRDSVPRELQGTN